jgi:hypothetical protein
VVWDDDDTWVVVGGYDAVSDDAVQNDMMIAVKSEQTIELILPRKGHNDQKMNR